MKSMRILAAALLAALATDAAALGALGDVHVYDRTLGQPLPVHWHEGRAYIVGKPGNEYALRVQNRSREEVLAVVSVDGVNVITGEIAALDQSGYVLAPGRTLELRGWRKNLASTAAFYFTPLPDSYAARTGRPDHVGAIGVAFFRKRQEPQPIGRGGPPAPFARREARSAANGAADAPGAGHDAPRAAEPAAKLGTGHGRIETSHARFVSFERATREPAEMVTVYYDSHPNLVARGVLPQPRSPRPLPHPFPGFVPDPQAQPFASSPYGC
jgi:hypothetical protein